ncbi:hypothetical protein BU26DRAFT_303248 [Trematosphaeria pertusa]|uniref:Uncharacterized protein n=1 Tax=Trematosphaeria pertusa TaxID=390896 RepID=A0A6A6IEY7_9PLEO|nr:uncharacterized protein BU26DRAFT_303248 [Trematosphaeria pertusa]KAF2248638.1 hypothetical protein BU26DRAFT_303248 [Trematosphaeria pertusa]
MVAGRWAADGHLSQCLTAALQHMTAATCGPRPAARIGGPFLHPSAPRAPRRHRLAAATPPASRQWSHLPSPLSTAANFTEPRAPRPAPRSPAVSPECCSTAQAQRRARPFPPPHWAAAASSANHCASPASIPSACAGHPRRTAGSVARCPSPASACSFRACLQLPSAVCSSAPCLPQRQHAPHWQHSPNLMPTSPAAQRLPACLPACLPTPFVSPLHNSSKHFLKPGTAGAPGRDVPSSFRARLLPTSRSSSLHSGQRRCTERSSWAAATVLPCFATCPPRQAKHLSPPWLCPRFTLLQPKSVE